MAPSQLYPVLRLLRPGRPGWPQNFYTDAGGGARTPMRKVESFALCPLDSQSVVSIHGPLGYEPYMLTTAPLCFTVVMPKKKNQRGLRNQSNCTQHADGHRPFRHAWPSPNLPRPKKQDFCACSTSRKSYDAMIAISHQRSANAPPGPCRPRVALAHDLHTMHHNEPSLPTQRTTWPR